MYIRLHKYKHVSLFSIACHETPDVDSKTLQQTYCTSFESCGPLLIDGVEVARYLWFRLALTSTPMANVWRRVSILEMQKPGRDVDGLLLGSEAMIKAEQCNFLVCTCLTRKLQVYDFIYSLSIFRPSASFCEALFDALSTVSSLLISSSKSQVTCPWVGRNNTNGARMKSVQIWAFALLDSTRCLKVQLLSCCGVCGAAKTHFCFDDVATEGTCLLLLVHFSVLNSENDSPHN